MEIKKAILWVGTVRMNIKGLVGHKEGIAKF